MQTQDLKYVKYKHQMERKKIDKIQSSSHLIDSEYRPAKSHIFFVDSKKQGLTFFLFSINLFNNLNKNLVEKFDPAKQMRTHPSLLNRRSNRLTIEQLKSTKLDIDDEQINVKIFFSGNFVKNLFFVVLENSKNAKEKIYGITKTN